MAANCHPVEGGPALLQRENPIDHGADAVQGEQIDDGGEILDDNGVVWEMKFDARSGSVLKNERDD